MFRLVAECSTATTTERIPLPRRGGTRVRRIRWAARCDFGSACGRSPTTRWPIDFIAKDYVRRSKQATANTPVSRAHVLRNPQQINGKSYRNAAGNSECVEVARQCFGAPPSSKWKPGNAVVGNEKVKKGTLIATFVDGKYKGHTALYLSQDSKGNIRVLDQWNAQGKVEERTIRNDPDRSLVNDSTSYEVVTW